MNVLASFTSTRQWVVGVASSAGFGSWCRDGDGDWHISMCSHVCSSPPSSAWCETTRNLSVQSPYWFFLTTSILPSTAALCENIFLKRQSAVFHRRHFPFYIQCFVFPVDEDLGEVGSRVKMYVKICISDLICGCNFPPTRGRLTPFTTCWLRRSVFMKLFLSGLVLNVKQGVGCWDCGTVDL